MKEMLNLRKAVKPLSFQMAGMAPVVMPELRNFDQVWCQFTPSGGTTRGQQQHPFGCFVRAKKCSFVFKLVIGACALNGLRVSHLDL